MSRGSKPGERRGGRKKGTPNKKTLLRNAAFIAAAADPNTSPLDFFLNLMNDKNLPLEIRVTAAHEALPYVHAKAANDDVHPKLWPSQYGASITDVKDLTTSSSDSCNDVPLKGSTSAAGVLEHEANRAVTDASPLSPLDFLLDLMKMPHVPARLRLRIASMAAPYVHRKPGRAAKLVTGIKNSYAFGIDLETAKAFREDKRLLAQLIANPRVDDLTSGQKKSDDLAAQLAERSKAFGCPTNYGQDAAHKDQKRLADIELKRRLRLKLSKDEDAEEALLMARLAAYEASPHGIEDKRRREEQLDELARMAVRRWELELRTSRNHCRR